MDDIHSDNYHGEALLSVITKMIDDKAVPEAISLSGRFRDIPSLVKAESMIGLALAPLDFEESVRFFDLALKHASNMHTSFFKAEKLLSDVITDITKATCVLIEEERRQVDV